MTVTLVLGGARSGKSRYAEQLARGRSARPIYLATSRIWDDDHARRIARHREDRGPEWHTIEEPKALSQIGVRDEVVLVDCVTLWLTNYFVDLAQDAERALAEARAELERALQLPNDWIFVSNEIGSGVHATTESGRKFTDLQGFMNQTIAARADHVVLMVAGIPLSVKGQA